LEKTNAYYGVNKTVLVRNGIDLNRFRKSFKTKEELKESLGLPWNSLVIGHIGRFSNEKNQIFLVDVFEKILETEKKAFLLFVGDGETKEIVERRVKSKGIRNVRFLGLRSDVPALLKSFDVFVLPSTYEGFPVTLIEAQASGLKCVISSAISEEVILSENTIRISLAEPFEVWIKAITRPIEKTKFYSNLELFDIKEVTKTLENLYKS
jgi:glycosyltransferase involved in cell wall biosynthesis